MFRIFLMVFLLGSAVSLQAAEQGITKWQHAEKKGYLKFFERSKNFGAVKRGSQLTHEFKFRNDGSGPVAILGVFSSCGCATVALEKGRYYAPGEIGSLTVSLDTTHYRGSLAKGISILTDAETGTSLNLALRAQIGEELKAEPPILDFGDANHGKSLEKTILIKPIAMAEPLAIKNVEYNSEVFRVRVEKAADGFRLLVTLRDDVHSGFVKETIIIENNSNYLAKLPVPVRAQVSGNISFSPNYLEFGAVAGGKEVRRTLEMGGLSGSSITAIRSELNINGQVVDDTGQHLVVENFAAAEQDNRNIRVRLKNTGLSGSVHGKLYLETDNPAEKEVTVKFYAFFKE